MSAKNTFTYAGIKDNEAVGNNNDWVYFVLGDPDDTALQAVASEVDYNFIPWNVTGSKGILIYRNRNFSQGIILMEL
ncbi:MAG: hypothetical protein GY751_07215 [Bacteroidetes bacterium]|nr:hypothetical protein [Bacteroidota bacterium]